jgi:tetratricopeptide (TPR) repeat protein
VSADSGRSDVADLGTRGCYAPDVVGLACGKVATVREQARLSLAAFAAALEPLLGWSPDPSLIEAWESVVPPPGQVVVACELLTARMSGRPSVPLPRPAESPEGGAAEDAAAMRAFRSADLRVGGGHLYASVVEYLTTRVAPRLVMASPGAEDQVIFTSAAAISEMAGWMAHDAGHDQVARQHFARALDLVSVSGDRQVTAHVLASIGHVALQLNEPDEALKTSKAGLQALAQGPCDPDLEARLLALEARGFARLREAAKAARSLSRAEKALGAERQEPRSEWVSGFDEGSLASDAARCMRQLGQLGEARRQAQRVVELRPADRPRSRAFGMFIHANVLLAQGQPEEACAVADDILQVTGGLGSHVVVQQFLELRRLLKPHKSSASVAEFLVRLNPVLRERLWFQRGFPIGGPLSDGPSGGIA